MPSPVLQPHLLMFITVQLLQWENQKSWHLEDKFFRGKMSRILLKDQAGDRVCLMQGVPTETNQKNRNHSRAFNRED